MSDTMERTTTTPQIRVRIAHTKTIKEGWGYESSVEVIVNGNDFLAHQSMNATLNDLLAMARVLGEEERDIRNQRDGRPVN